MKYAIPQVGDLEINTVVLDLNGTLSVKGAIPEGAKERLEKLRALGVQIVLFTGDQRGTAEELCTSLGIEYRIAKSSQEKEVQMKSFDPNTTAAIGNARIDIGTFKNAAISIATLQSEGIHAGILPYVDVLVPSINDALDLLIEPETLQATMRM